MQSNKETNESGRSLLEMIAIIVVLIILVIGGIMLYRFAMATHEASVIHDDLMIRGRLGREGRPHQGKQFSVEMENKTRLGTDIVATEEADGIYYSFSVSSIKMDVCVKMLEKDYKGANRITINEETFAVDAAGNIVGNPECLQENFIKVTFSKNTGYHGSYIPRICTTDNDCPRQGKQGARRCIRGVCTDQCDPPCNPETQVCFQGECKPKGNCEKGHCCPNSCCTCNQDTDICLSCNAGYYLSDDKCIDCPAHATCESCSPQPFECKSGFQKTADETGCYCPEGYVYDPDEDTCEECPKGYYCPGPGGGDGDEDDDDDDDDNDGGDKIPCSCGTYNNTKGATDESACLACSEGTWAESGSASCSSTCPEHQLPANNKCGCICAPSGTRGAAGGCEDEQIADGACGCVAACPTVPGMTGAVDAQNHCLCDTTQGYEAVSDHDVFCNCDNSRYYWNKPDGSCMTCAQTTRAWAIKQGGDLDPNSVVESVWFCGYYKYLEQNRTPYFYNPTDKNYCTTQFQVLEKNAAGDFFCSEVCGGPFNTYKAGDRASGWGYCGCMWYSKWDGERCVPKCDDDSPYAYWNSKEQKSFCYACALNQPSYTYGVCKPADYRCSANQHWDYRRWYEATPEQCKPTDGSYAVQTADGGVCDSIHGCSTIGVVPPCEYNSIITADCTCPTGGDIGQYCCHAAQIMTPTECKTCTRGTKPNADRTACVPVKTCAAGLYLDTLTLNCLPCPDNTISKAGGQCVDCGAGTANETHTDCDCNDNATHNPDTLLCSCKTNFVLDETNNTCYCPAGYGLEDGVCSPCQDNTISKANGQCLDCDAGTPNNDHTDCTCYTNGDHDDNTLLCSCPPNFPYKSYGAQGSLGGLCGICREDKGERGIDSGCSADRPFCVDNRYYPRTGVLQARVPSPNACVPDGWLNHASQWAGTDCVPCLSNYNGYCTNGYGCNHATLSCDPNYSTTACE